jgi:hypothetical protein
VTLKEPISKLNVYVGNDKTPFFNSVKTNFNEFRRYPTIT